MVIRAPQISREHGFAWPELVVLIALAVMVASFAVPRFVALGDEAQTAAMQTLFGKLRSQSAHAHALWLAQEQPDSVLMDGRQVAMRHGYPSARAIAELLGPDVRIVAAYTDGTLVLARASADQQPLAGCSVRYRSATSPMLAPEISLDTSGC